MAGPQEATKIVDTFKDKPFADQGPGWDSLWKENHTPWDRGGPGPALEELLAGRADISTGPGSTPDGGKKKKALVPGCGRGYDALLISAFGYDVVGLDCSATATAQAVENEKRVGGEDVYAARSGREKGSVVWLTGDFFGDGFLMEAGVDQFDLIYDYTFFCALPPSGRPAWAKRMTQLLAPGGRLICHEWPTLKPLDQPGPPWGLRPEIYVAHLARPGEEVPYAQGGQLAEGGSPSDPDPDSGLRRIAHIRPARSYETGYDDQGNVVDTVSIWCH